DISAAVRLLGILSTSALRLSFESIVARHASLRTQFRCIDGRPLQFVCEKVCIAVPVLDLTAADARVRHPLARKAAKAFSRARFRLSEDLLFRIGLVRISSCEHVLLVTLHHIISDGWSMNILMGELKVMYKAYLAGSAAMLPKLPIQ